MNEKFEYVDIEYLEEISGGDNVFIFLKQIPEFVSNMHQFLSEKKYGMLAKEAHTAKSSVLIFKMEETGNILKKIQLLAEKNETATIPEMIRKVETTLNGASMELSVYLNEI